MLCIIRMATFSLYNLILRHAYVTTYSGFFGDLGLLRVDNVHDEAAFAHLSEAGLDDERTLHSLQTYDGLEKNRILLINKKSFFETNPMEQNEKMNGNQINCYSHFVNLKRCKTNHELF